MRMNLVNGKDFKSHTLPQLDDLYRTALFMADNESEAQELVMETFAMAYHSWPKYQFDSNCRMWLFKIMVNALIGKYRPSVGTSAVSKSAEATSEDLKRCRLLDSRSVVKTMHNLLSLMSEDDVKKVIRNLPNEYRLILILSLLEGFSYQEIADIVGIDLATVGSKLNEGRNLMHRHLLDRMTSERIRNLAQDRVGGGGMST